MKILIPIPELNSYGIITFILLGLSSFTLPLQICLRFLKGKVQHLMQISAGVKFGIVIWGFWLFPQVSLFARNWKIEIFSIVIGLAWGALIVRVEKKVNRFFGRSSRVVRLNNADFLKSYDLKNTKINNGKKSALNSQQITINLNLISVIIIAIMEEMIFRGYFLIIAKTFSICLGFCFIVFSIYIFGISHITLGKHHAWLKGAYAASFIVITYCLESVSAAIAAHITLNIMAWRNQKFALFNTDAEYFSV